TPPAAAQTHRTPPDRSYAATAAGQSSCQTTGPWPVPSSASSDSQQPSPGPATMATRTDQILACPADKPHGSGHVLSIFSLLRAHRGRPAACAFRPIPPDGRSRRPRSTGHAPDRARPGWCLAPARSLTQAGPRPDAQPTPVVGRAVGAGWFQPGPPCMAGRRLRSRMLTAVAVLPLTVAATATWCPVLTAAMPSRRASTLVEPATWYVLTKPSALLTVIEVAPTGVTDPRWVSIVG